MKDYTLVDPTARQMKQRKLEELSNALLTLASFLILPIGIFAFCMILDPFEPDLLIIMAVAALILSVAGIIIGKAAKACGKKTSKSR